MTVVEPGARGTAIDGLTIWSLSVHRDARGSFKENWQRQRMTAAGLPDFGPVQHNIALNDAAGVTRGIHAEPWDKFVSVATGRVFGAWVDLRDGPGFGTVVTAEIDPGTAVFVPRGVGNAYQVLEPGTAYSYLVNEHWSADVEYVAVNVADPALGITWPIPLDSADPPKNAVISDKDRAAPMLAEVSPIGPKRILVLGANGQLGRALAAEFAGATHVDFASRNEVNLAARGGATGRRGGVITVRDSAGPLPGRRWAEYGAVINAAAFTAVDAAETDRAAAWAVNATGVAELARVCAAHRITLVHVSSDYVFDGSADRPYLEGDPVAPLSVYGQSKAAGDAAAAMAPRHYLLRTSWVIGDGANFVRTMARLARGGDVSPQVVDDQIGRPTFAAELARAARFLLAAEAPFGTYNVTGAGESASWFEVAREVFSLVGADPSRVRPVSTADYTAGRPGPTAPRPRFSVLDLGKLSAAGFTMPEWRESLRRYLHQSG